MQVPTSKACPDFPSYFFSFISYSLLILLCVFLLHLLYILLSGVHPYPIQYHPYPNRITFNIICVPHISPLYPLSSSLIDRQTSHRHTQWTCFLSWAQFLVTRIQKGKCKATHCFANLRICLCGVLNHTTAIL